MNFPGIGEWDVHLKLESMISMDQFGTSYLPMSLAMHEMR